MKNKILIGTVAFVAVLAAIGILAISFTMTPAIATNATNATQTLQVGCTVAIKLEDNSSSGGSGSQTQTCLDNQQNATVWSSNFTTDNNYTLKNSCWSNPIPPNDGLAIKNIGNNWIKVQAELLSDNGAGTGGSFTGTAGGQFFVNANNGDDDNYGYDTLDACYKNLTIDFAELTVGGGAKTLCAYMDYHNSQNHLIVNDKWILNQKTPDVYTFLLQITASEATCNESALPAQEDDFYTVSYGTNIAVISYRNGAFTPVDPVSAGGTRALATVAGGGTKPANNQATDVGRAVTATVVSPNIYFIPYINSGETGTSAHLYFVQVNGATYNFINGAGEMTAALTTKGFNTADTPMAIGSDGGDFINGVSAPHVQILAKRDGTWWIYDYSVNLATTTPVVTLTGGFPYQMGVLPNFSKFLGLVTNGSDVWVSWLDTNGVTHLSLFTNNGTLVDLGAVTDLPLSGLTANSGGTGYLGLAWTSTNAALVHESLYTFGPGADDMRYAVDGALPFSNGGDPRGMDYVATGLPPA
jgi:hypothetical protein